MLSCWGDQDPPIPQRDLHSKRLQLSWPAKYHERNTTQLSLDDSASGQDKRRCLLLERITHAKWRCRAKVKEASPCMLAGAAGAAGCEGAAMLSSNSRRLGAAAALVGLRLA